MIYDENLNSPKGSLNSDGEFGFGSDYYESKMRFQKSITLKILNKFKCFNTWTNTLVMFV